MTTIPGTTPSIAQLLAVPADVRDVPWLQQSLQTAVALELSTLPPYLCGWWSIDPSGDGAAAGLIGSVVYEEMLHMGLACNMLVAVGGTPSIVAALPSYPCALPGGVRPGLTVSLSGLTLDYVSDVYLQIEYPESGPVAATEDGPPTIGAFYDAIAAAFESSQPSIGTDHQLSTWIQDESLSVLATVDDVLAAIEEIKEQGEGTSTSPDAVAFGGELAHYYRFAEIYNGRTLVEVDGTWQYAGDVVPFPPTFPMATVPAGGWPDPPPEVAQLLGQFSQTLGSVLSDLEQAWGAGGSDSLNAAIGTMFSLRGPAVELMQIELPGGDGRYGPDFRLDVTAP